MRHYPRAWLRDDLLAGVTTGAVVIPQAMAYGTIAGLPVEVGLYTCIVPMATYALLGGSRRLSLSTTSTIVALTGAAIVAAGVGTETGEALAAATTLTLMVGLALLVARALRLGFVVEAVSEAVLSGLKVGVGLSIAASQLPKLLGIAPSDDGFFADVANAVRGLDEANGWTVAISAVTLGVMLALRVWAPKVPGPLVAVVGGILVVVVLGLEDDGVALIPEVPRGLPAPALPGLDHVDELLPFALAIAMMAFLESVSVARATRESHDPPLDNGQELVAVGAASVLGSLFSAVPAAGGFSQSLVNAGAGARTQLSELVTALLAVATALALAPLLSDLPEATLGAIVLIAVSGLLGPHDLVRLGRIDPVELAVALVTAAVALTVGLLAGVGVGVVLTFYLVLRALNHPVVIELRRPPGGAGPLAPARPGDELVPGLLALRIEGGLYTVNVRGVQADIQARVDAMTPPPRRGAPRRGGHGRHLGHRVGRLRRDRRAPGRAGDDAVGGGVADPGPAEGEPHGGLSPVGRERPGAPVGRSGGRRLRAPIPTRRRPTGLTSQPDLADESIAAARSPAPGEATGGERGHRRRR